LRQEQNNIFAGIDWILILLYFLLVAFGWMNIYAASKTEEEVELLSFSTKYGKQLIFICCAIPLIITILFFNSKFYEKYSSIFYIIFQFSAYYYYSLLEKKSMEQNLGLILEF